MEVLSRIPDLSLNHTMIMGIWVPVLRWEVEDPYYPPGQISNYNTKRAPILFTPHRQPYFLVGLPVSFMSRQVANVHRHFS